MLWGIKKTQEGLNNMTLNMKGQGGVKRMLKEGRSPWEPGILPVARYLEHFALVTFNIWPFIPILHMLV